METKGYVYLIEDDVSVHKSLTRALSKQGLEVIGFTTASAFLAAAPKHTPEMILLDMQMPGLTGLQLQEKMNKQGRSTPIIFISGQSHPQQIIESLKKGAVDFLLKPFNLADLTKAILRALQDFGRTQLTGLTALRQPAIMLAKSSFPWVKRLFTIAP